MTIRNKIIALCSVMLLFSCGQGNTPARKNENPLANYTKLEPFQNGFASVGIGKQFGYIDKKGHNVVPCKYSFVYGFDNGLSVVELNKKHGVVDGTGREIVPLKYDFIDGFDDSNRALVKFGGKWGYIDRKGNEVIPVIYDHANYFREEITTVEENGQWYIIDTLNNRKPVRYDVYKLGSFNDGLASISLLGESGKGYINKQGKIVIAPQYDDVYDFKDGLGMVKRDEKAGFINKKGEVVVPLLYEGYPDFVNGTAAVHLKDSENYGFIDKKGTLVIPMQYANINDFYDGLAIIRVDGKYGCINIKGETVMPCIYDRMYSGEGKLAVMKDGKGYFTDTKGKVLFPEVYQDVYGFKDGVALVKQNGNWLYIDKTGKRLF